MVNYSFLQASEKQAAVSTKASANFFKPSAHEQLAALIKHRFALGKAMQRGC